MSLLQVEAITYSHHSLLSLPILVFAFIGVNERIRLQRHSQGHIFSIVIAISEFLCAVTVFVLSITRITINGMASTREI